MSEAAEYSAELIDLLECLDIQAALDKVKRVRDQRGDRVVAGMIGMAADTEEAGILAYTLTTMLLRDQEEALWHRVARDMLSNELCHYSHAYAASIVHARRACELEPDNVQDWELLIDIGSNRTQILRGTDEIRDAAEQIRRLDPDNKRGQFYLE